MVMVLHQAQLKISHVALIVIVREAHGKDLEKSLVS